MDISTVVPEDVAFVGRVEHSVSQQKIEKTKT